MELQAVVKAFFSEFDKLATVLGASFANNSTFKVPWSVVIVACMRNSLRFNVLLVVRSAAKLPRIKKASHNGRLFY